MYCVINLELTHCGFSDKKIDFTIEFFPEGLFFMNLGSKHELVPCRLINFHFLLLGATSARMDINEQEENIFI